MAPPTTRCGRFCPASFRLRCHLAAVASASRAPSCWRQDLHTGMLSTMSFNARNERDAALAAVLAQGVREGKVHAVDALRVIKHEMRRRNTNKHAGLPFRSAKAQAVIDECAKAGVPVPKNDSEDALHADHVHELGPADLHNTIAVDDWIGGAGGY